MEEILYTPLVVVHVISCAFLILVVLLQPGKSGGMGAFAGVAATQVFGGRGAGNILTKITWVTASTFFVTSLTLAFLSTSRDDSLVAKAEEIGPVETKDLPAAPARTPSSGKAEESTPPPPAPVPSEVPSAAEPPSPLPDTAAADSASPPGSAAVPPSGVASGAAARPRPVLPRALAVPPRAPATPPRAPVPPATPPVESPAPAPAPARPADSQ